MGWLTFIFVLLPGGYQDQIEEQIIIQPETQTVEESVKTITVPELITYYSDQYDISDEVPLAIASAESDYLNKCNQEYGCIAGIGTFQIVQSTFDEQCLSTTTADVYNKYDNIKCGVKMIANGDYWRWKPSEHEWLFNISTSTRQEIRTVCNCVTGIRSFGVNIPIGTNAEDLPKNSTPHVGGVVLFFYGNDVYHAALIIELTGEYMIVKETNFKKCKETVRKVYFDDVFIIGYYSPN